MMIRLIALMLFLGVILAGCAQGQTADGTLPQATDDGATRVAEAKEGSIAPDFTITSTEGEQIAISSFAENETPVLVYFMATWCPYCKQDYTVLSEFYDEYDNDVPIISISLDLTEDAAMLADYKEGYPELDRMVFAPGSSDILTAYNVRSTTTKYAIGRDGRIIYRGAGAFTEAQWRTLLQALRDS